MLSKNRSRPASPAPVERPVGLAGAVALDNEMGSKIHDDACDGHNRMWSALAEFNVTPSSIMPCPAAGADERRCKNLLVRDKGGAHFMLVAAESAKISFPHVRREIGARRSLSLVRDTDVAVLLNGMAVPGSVSPLALLGQSTVTLVMDMHLVERDDALWHVDGPTTAVALPPGEMAALCRRDGVPTVVCSFTPEDS